MAVLRLVDVIAAHHEPFEGNWFLHWSQVVTGELAVTIDVLEPSTIYEASVVAFGKDGNSLPSPVIFFLTYPRQLPTGSMC